MLDRKTLAAAREALGIEKAAEAAPERVPTEPCVPSIARFVAVKVAASAAPDQLGMLEKSAGGLGQVLAKLLHRTKQVAGLGALAGGGYLAYDAGRQAGADEARPPMPMMMPTPMHGAPAFTPDERAQFARHGMDPERLSFMKTLAGYRQGMDLERKMMADALAGKAPTAGATEDELAQFA